MLSPLYPIDNAPATVLVVAPGASAGDTSVPIAPLTTALPIAFILDFGASKFAKLAIAGAVDDETLTVEPLPTDLDPGDEADLPGSVGAARLSGTYAALSPDERAAVHVLAEQLLELTAGYEGDDAERFGVAIVEEINFLLERGDEPVIKRAIAQGGTAISTTFRDRYLSPDAMAIVARVTGRQQVRFTPPFAGV